MPTLHSLPDTTRRTALDDLGQRIIGLAGRLSAAACRWLVLVAEFDAADGAAAWGFPTTAPWLMHYCGLARRTAFEHVRVAHALACHEPLAAAMASGRLSYSQARAISRVADIATPALIASLITTAEHGSGEQLEVVVRGLRTVDALDHGDADDVPRETLSSGWAEDSRWRCSARLAPERGELVESALAALAGR